ncbi:MAG: class I SAM-dependent methyltransferase [Actinomycetaceae bacterium]|nr:class I SAM-dependent methyltransferase [Actinomycetaceae bacterium]
MEIWDIVAPVYKTFVSSDKQGYAHVQTFIRTFVSPSMRVLELGCGPGNMTERIASACGTVVATDASERMIRQAQKSVQIDNVSFEVANAHNLPYPDGSFDAVVASNMFHVVEDPEQILTEAARVLRPGGSIIATSFITGTKRAQIMKQGLKVVNGKDHEFWDLTGFVNLFRDNGWTVHAGRRFSSIFPIAGVVATKTSVNAQRPSAIQ